MIENFNGISQATSSDITFFHSNKYIEEAKVTKAYACITKNELSKFLPKKCLPLISKNVLLDAAGENTI